MDSFAYLDPGTGSLVLQALIGGILAVVVALRGYARAWYYKVKTLLSRRDSVNDEV